MADRKFDPAQVEVWRHLMASVADEMGATLERTAYSPNIKERLDHSCAIFDSAGRLLAQAAHIPVHLGAMPLMLQTLRHTLKWPAGTMWLCNDPRRGGTHLPDLTLVAPVRDGRRLLGFVASRAHHADIGGLSPGSLPLSTELFHEGLVLSPIRLVERGKLRPDVLDLVCANSRTPHERRGDIAAQIAANEIGIRRMRDLVHRHGYPEFRKRAAESIAYAAEMIRRALAALPAGEYAASDVLDGDASGERVIRVRITIAPQEDAVFDFTGTSPQAHGSLNATEAITRSACYYVVRCLVGEEVPTNEGCFAPLTVIAPEGTVVNARFPAAVAAGNVETSQRIVDVVIAALAQAAPDRLPACSQGTMNNLTIGGFDTVRQRAFAYYETIAGGAGASPESSGASGIQTHMTNTRNTPVESLESHYPLRVLEYRINRGTGGRGLHSGGDGVVRSIQLLGSAQVTLISERRNHPPPGAAGGDPGTVGSASVQFPDGETREMPGKWSESLPAGAVVTVRTPGGGGWGEVV
jgi:N-methylhydantoinase B